jgi:hypothetical protein
MVAGWLLGPARLQMHADRALDAYP